jgi:Xaa-Pro aminopeptidase
VAASYQRYWSELGDTFCLGEPGKHVVASHELAKQVFERLLRDIRVGAALPSAEACLNGVASAAVRESLTAYGLVNGLGLDLTEAPDLAGTPGGGLQPGTTLTLRACMTTEDGAYALVSRPYVATKTGLDPLADRPTRLVPLAG